MCVVNLSVVNLQPSIHTFNATTVERTAASQLSQCVFVYLCVCVCVCVCACVFVCVCSEGETQYDALYNNEITKFPWQQPKRESGRVNE